jgi:pimeloyl-ACP methyl ester carboxylesterase
MSRRTDLPQLFMAIFSTLFVSGAAAQAGIVLDADDGASISADLYGAGRCGVVLAHGYRFDKGSWAPQAHALRERGFRVIAIDFRGYGESKGAGEANPLQAPLHLDVLAAVSYLRENGVTDVSVIGASMGAEAAARASAHADDGSIGHLVLLAGGVSVSAAQLKGRKLFAVAQGDLDPSGAPLLDKITQSYIAASEPKELLIVDGSAHAQALFRTDRGAELMSKIVSFLSDNESCDG